MIIKMPQIKKNTTIKFDRNMLKKIIIEQNAFITDIFRKCAVPDSGQQDNFEDDLYVTSSKTMGGKKKLGNKSTASGGDSSAAAKSSAENRGITIGGKRAKNIDELQTRIDIMKNKHESKKSKPSPKATKKKEIKRLKRENQLKKHVISIAKSNKNEKVKEGKNQQADLIASTGASAAEGADVKDEKKKIIYNEDGKMGFSRFEFAAQKNKRKKGKHEKEIKDTRQIIQKLKKQKKELDTLVESGEVEKAKEIQTELSWKKAFDRTEGKKVKDDINKLYRSVTQKKKLKKQSKKVWKDRTEKVKKDIDNRQKKRQDNIDKKKDEKKKNKLKKMSKQGRVIPGYG